MLEISAVVTDRVVRIARCTRAYSVAGADLGAPVLSAVPPIMVKTAANPGGLPKEVFDGFQQQTAYNRAQFFLDDTINEDLLRFVKT